MAPQMDAFDPGLTVGVFLEEWLAHARGRVRAATYEGYEALIRCHALPSLAEVPLVDLAPLRLQRLYRELMSERRGRRLSSGTVLNLHLVLSQALGQAVRWQLVAVNAAAGAQPPRPRRTEPVVVDVALTGRLLDGSAGTPLELPAAIALATGMRRGEILALRWRGVSDDLTVAQVRATLQSTSDGLVFEQPKTARSKRAVALPAFLRPYLEAQRAKQATLRNSDGWVEHGLVVTRADGSPVNPDSLSSAWRRLLRSKGLPPVRFHDLRHAHATLMLLQGVHPKVVSERLGHASVGITLDTYSHVLPSMQSDAVDAFDRLFPCAA
jgi:integrase